MHFVAVAIAGALAVLAAGALWLSSRGVCGQPLQSRARAAQLVVALYVLALAILFVAFLGRSSAVPPDASLKAARLAGLISAAMTTSVGVVVGAVPTMIAVSLFRRARRL